jgi:hypothetical protein
MLGHTKGALTSAATAAATTANKQIHSYIGQTVVLEGSRKQDVLSNAVSGLSKGNCMLGNIHARCQPLQMNEHHTDIHT